MQQGKKLRFLTILGTMALWFLFGTFLFCSTEDWSMFESFYFCFITLTTIGTARPKCTFAWRSDPAATPHDAA